MFQSRKDLTERVAALETELSESEVALLSAASTIETQKEAVSALTQDLDADREELAGAQADLAEADAELKAVNASLSEAQTKLATFDSEVEAAAQAKAAQHLERLGHPALELDQDDDDQDTPVPDVLAKFESIDDPAEAYAFAKANREAINSAIFKN